MINYRFNEWRQTGETAEVWSPMAYRLVSKNAHVAHINGFNIGNVLYLHYVKGMTAQEIRKTPVGYGLATNLIKGILKGFSRGTYKVGIDSLEAYEIAMYMIECEPETLEKMYRN